MNHGILPLDRNKLTKIAVIGPNSDVCRLGSSSGTPIKSVSLLDGIRSYLDEKVKVLHAKGCMIALNDTHSSYLNFHHVNDVNFVSLENNLPLIEEAVEIANEADVVVLALGENSFLARKTRSKNHLGDRASLDLTESQIKLAEEVLKTGKSVILYLTHGRPITLSALADQSKAILTGHYTGQESGTAAAEALFGEFNPSGKLTVSWPQSIQQLPVHYNQPRTAILHDYIDSPVAPAYPFGFGLSYTSFEYSEPSLSSETIVPNGNVEVTFELTNTGYRRGTEIAQLYISGEAFAIARPALELKGFQRVTLDPGETKLVTINLDATDLYFYDNHLKRVLPKGKFLIRVGSSSQNLSNPVILESGESSAVPITKMEPAPIRENQKPNILFVAIDDLRPELGTYGANVKTPNIDRLAATGMRFDKAYCQQAVCGASRLSVMSGLYPTATREQNYHVSGWRERHPDLLTINQHFGEQGYETIGLGKIYHGTSGESVDPKNWQRWINLTAPDYANLESIEALRQATERAE